MSSLCTRTMQTVIAAFIAAFFLFTVFGNPKGALQYNHLMKGLMIALLSGGITLMGLLCRLAFLHVHGLWIPILILEVGLISGGWWIFSLIGMPNHDPFSFLNEDPFWEYLLIASWLSLPAGIILYALIKYIPLKYGIVQGTTLQRYCRPAYLALHFGLLALFPVVLFYRPSEEALDRQAESTYRERRILADSNTRLIRMEKTSPHPHIREYIYIHQDADNSNRRSEWSIQISDKGAILH